MRIATVDDDREFGKKAKEIVRKSCEGTGEAADILCVTEGDTLLETAEGRGRRE